MTSRELDAQVAEKVMGWKRDFRLSKSHSEAWRVVAEGDVTGQFIQPLSWSPSTSIEAAWEVVEKMQDTDRKFQIESSTGCNGKWGAVFSQYHEPFGEAWGWAETAPEAICLAALKAINLKGKL